MSETCQNPLSKCESTDPANIILYIRLEQKDHPICQQCWNKIGESDIQWETTEEKLVTVQEEITQPFTTKKLRTL